MKEFPKHLSLMKENSDHFVIHDARDNKTFPVSKKAIHPAHQIRIMKMKKYCGGGQVRGFSGGGIEGDSLGDVEGNTDTHENWGDSPEGQSEFSSMQQANGQPPPIFKDMPDISGRGVPPMQPGQTPPLFQGLPDISQRGEAPSPQHNPQGQQPGPSTPNQYPTLGSFNAQQKQAAEGMNQAAQGQLEQNSQFANAQKQYMALEQERNAKYQERMLQYQTQNDQLTKDVLDKKINPEQYWENHSRVGAALAVLVSGLGAGLQHSTTNQAWQVIQNGIDKSIDAQKAELGKKENLLSNNLRVQGNLTQAENATRLQTGAMLQGKLAQIAAETGDPMIIGNAKAKIAEMKMSQMPMQQQLAQYQTQMAMRERLSKMNTSQMDPAQLVPYVVANDRQPKVYEEIKDLQNINRIAKPSLQAFDQAAQEVRPATGLDKTSLTSIIPGMESPGQKAWRGMANTTVKDVEGTARQAAFKSLEDNFKPQFGDSDETILSKRNGWINYLQSHASAPTAMGEHLDLNKFESTRFPKEVLSPHPMEGKTGIDKATGQRVMMRNGQVVPIGR